MSELVVQTRAIEVKRAPGGRKTKLIEKTVGKLGIMRKYETRKVSGSDYVIFNCPKCGQRNKSVVYEALDSFKEDEKSEAILTFVCKGRGCFQAVEVLPPAKHEKSRIIIP